MERLKYIDTAKGLAIVSIVLLHFENGIFSPQLNLFISAYMITMFYVTAGWLDAAKGEYRSIYDIAKRRWNQLMMPYIYWTIIILLFDIVLWCFKYYDSYFIARELYKSITLRGIGTLWFLPALYGGSILWNFTKNRNKWYIYIAMLMFALCYQHFYHDIFDSMTDNIGRLIDSPFRAVNAMFGAWIGIATGYFFHKKVIRTDRVLNEILYFFMGLSLCAISYIIETKLHVNAIIWTLSAPILSPLGLIWIIKSLEKVPFLNKIFLPLTYCGKHSMVIMVTHYSIVLVLCTIIHHKIMGSSMLVGINSLVWFVVAMALECFLIIKLERGIPLLFGRKS